MSIWFQQWKTEHLEHVQLILDFSKCENQNFFQDNSLCYGHALLKI
jgi:hypothetical protein